MRRGMRPDAAGKLARAEPRGVAGCSSERRARAAAGGERHVRGAPASGVRHLVDLGGHGDIGVVRMVVEDVILHLVVVDEPQFAIGARVRLLVHGSNLGSDDLLVVGSPTHGAILASMLGSTATGCSWRRHPVVVVPTAAVASEVGRRTHHGAGQR